MWAYQPSRLCECWAASCRPAPVVIRITSGTFELAAGHVQQRGGVVEDLVEREQAEVDGHDLDDRPHPPIAAPMPAPTNADSDSGVSRIRSGPNSSSSPRLTAKQPPYLADVLAHQEDPVVARASPRGSPRASPRGTSSRRSRWQPAPGRTRADVVSSRLRLGVHEPGQVLDRLQRRRLGRRHRPVDLGGDLGAPSRRRPSSSSSPSARQLARPAGRSGRARASGATSALSR